MRTDADRTDRGVGTDGTDSAGGRTGRLALRAGLVAAGLFAGLLLLIPEQFRDPFLRHDDWPAILPDASLYYWKTLAKGRWVNWLWMLRGWPVGSGTVFALFMALWCLTAAFIGCGMVGAGRGWPTAALASAAVAAMPQMADMAAWPGTTLPAAAALCLQAGIATLAGPRAALLALPVLVPVALMGHSTFPLMLLVATALVAGPAPGRRYWLALPAVFLAALGLGVLVMFAINLAVHGHFGIVTEAWLDTDVPGGGLARAQAVLGWFAGLLVLAGAGQPAGAALLLALAGLAALLLARGRSAVLPVVLAAGAVALVLGAAPILVEGIETPFRATGEQWLLLVGVPALALREVAAPARRVVLAAGLAAATGIGGSLWHGLHARALPPYQAMTRALAAEIRAAAPDGVVTLAVFGQVHGLEATEHLQYALGFQFRMARLLGAEVVLCDRQTIDAERAVEARDDPQTQASFAGWQRRVATARAVCPAQAEAAGALRPWPTEGLPRAVAPGVVVLLLPDRPRRDAAP